MKTWPLGAFGRRRHPHRKRKDTPCTTLERHTILGTFCPSQDMEAFVKYRARKLLQKVEEAEGGKQEGDSGAAELRRRAHAEQKRPLFPELGDDDDELV